MAKPIYIDRKGGTIPKKEWQLKRADSEYFNVKMYDNGVVQLQLKWSGIVPIVDTLSEYYPVYVLLVKNYREDGTLVVDPIDSDKTYPDEETAIAAYDSFLLEWTDCGVDETGVLIERDNTCAPVVPLAPPPPPDPDVPTSEPTELDGCGAW